MSNDIPDWTSQHQAQLQGGSSLKFLGDTGAPALAADSATLTTSSGQLAFAGAVIASLKVLTNYALVKAGTALLGTATAVNPLYGQNTTAGNLGVACVTAPSGGAEPTTTAGSWVKVVSVNTSAGWCAIWVRPNLGSSEAAPQFTGGQAGNPLMAAQLFEYSGGVTSSAADQTGSGSSSGPGLTVVTASADAAFGELVVVCSRWVYNVIVSGQTYSLAFNNSATGVQDGSPADNSQSHTAQSVFAHTIVPAGITSLPVGVAPWNVDAQGTSVPATGVKASVVLAATPGKTYTLTDLAGSFGATAAPGGAVAQPLQVLDGASVIYSTELRCQNIAGAIDRFGIAGLARKGTAGNSMTAQFVALQASMNEEVTIGAYLR